MYNALHLHIGTFVDEARGEIQLLQDDITRLLRFDEDAAIRRERLGEDRDRRIAQLQRQRQVIASRAPVGDQQGLERNRQAQQDLTARIASLRGDFNVRLDRFDEDRDLRRDRLIEDALKRLADAQSRGLRRPEEDESLVRKLLVSLGNTITNSLSNAVGDAISNFALDALSKPIQNLFDSIKNLFDGDDDGDTDGDGTGGADTSTDSTPTLTAPTEALAVLTASIPTLTAPLESLAVLTHSTPTLAAPLESLEVLTHSTPTLTLPTEALMIPTKSTPQVTLPTEALNLPVNDITPKVNLPETFDLSQVPVLLPDAILDVKTPKSFDLSTVPVTLPAATTFPITLPKSIDLSDLPVTLPETPIDIPVEDITPKIELPERIDLSDVPVTPPSVTVNVTTPETIDLSSAGVILPAGLQSLLDALGGGDGDGALPGNGPGEAPGEGPGRGQGDGGLSEQARQNILNEERRARRDINEGNAVPTGITSSDLTEGLRNRSSGGNPLDLNRILDGFERLIESGLSGLPDFLEPFVREIASQGVGVSSEGGQTFLTTADGTRIATLSQDEDSGATTVATLPEAVTGGDTSGTDDSTVLRYNDNCQNWRWGSGSSGYQPTAN